MRKLIQSLIHVSSSNGFGQGNNSSRRYPRSCFQLKKKMKKEEEGDLELTWSADLELSGHLNNLICPMVAT